MKWYEKAIPKINDVLPYLKEAATSMLKNPDVSSVRLWGGIAENFNNKNYRIKDIDILIKCNFDSGDLLAIDTSSNGALKTSKSELEDLGFNPRSVLFTQSILKLKSPFVDFWAISNDNKVLHWGLITDTIEEWKQVRKEAESRTEETTGFKKQQIILASNADRKKWQEIYEDFIREFSNGCPQGWYSSQNDAEKLLNKSIPL
jgi:hypothetical protein